MYPEIHLAYLLLASNIEALAGLPALMQRLGIDSTVISTLDYLAAPSLIDETFSPLEGGKIEKARSALRQAAAEADHLGLGFHYQFPRPAALKNGCSENIDRSLFVSADGSISPCVFVNIPADIAAANRRVFGNVHEKDPVAIWENDAYQLFRDRLGKGDPDLPCQTCRKRFHRQG